MTANVTEQVSSSEIVSKHKEYIWPCAATYYEHPIALERGEGMYVWDTEGSRYLDCFGGVMNPPTPMIGSAMNAATCPVVEV